MPRARLIRSDDLPYHVYARSNNKEWFYLPMKEVWEVFCWKWKNVVDGLDAKIHAFVLMSNHFHAILTTPRANIDAIMEHFMRESAREINSKAERINHLYGGPYGWSLIRERHHYEQVVRYVHQNPLEAGMCERVEDYSYGSLFYQHRGISLPFEMEPSRFELDRVGDTPIYRRLDWLNMRYVQEERDAIRRALRHSVFTPKGDRRTHRIPSVLLPTTL